VRCCYFHFKQSLWRKVSALGLVTAYRGRSRRCRLLRKAIQMHHPLLGLRPRAPDSAAPGKLFTPNFFKTLLRHSIKVFTTAGVNSKNLHYKRSCIPSVPARTNRLVLDYRRLNHFFPTDRNIHRCCERFKVIRASL
jgi:hypothetical protein